MITRLVLAGSVACALAAPPAARAQAPRKPSDPAIARYFSLVRANYSGDSARAVTGFVEQYFRLPGNAGFDASIERVRAILERAGYVKEEGAPAGAPLTYRVEKRTMAAPTWEPVDAIADDRRPEHPGAPLHDQSQHALDRFVLDARGRRGSGARRRGEGDAAGARMRRTSPGRSSSRTASSGSCSARPYKSAARSASLSYQHAGVHAAGDQSHVDSVRPDPARQREAVVGIAPCRTRPARRSSGAREGAGACARRRRKSKIYRVRRAHARRRGARQRARRTSATSSARTCRSPARTTTRPASATSARWHACSPSS